MAGCMVPYDSQGHLGMPYSQGYDEGAGFTAFYVDVAKSQEGQRIRGSPT